MYTYFCSWNDAAVSCARAVFFVLHFFTETREVVITMLNEEMGQQEQEHIIGDGPLCLVSIYIPQKF